MVEKKLKNKTKQFYNSRTFILNIIDDTFFFCKDYYKTLIWKYLLCYLPIIFVALFFMAKIRQVTISSDNISFFAVALTICALWKNFCELSLAQDIFGIFSGTNSKLSSKNRIDHVFKNFKAFCRLLIIDAVIFIPLVFTILIFELPLLLILFYLFSVILLYSFARFFALSCYNYSLTKIISNYFNFLSDSIKQQLFLLFFFNILYIMFFINVVVISGCILSLFHIFSGLDTFASNLSLHADITPVFSFFFTKTKIAIYLFSTFLVANFFVTICSAITFFYFKSEESGADLIADINVLSRKKFNKFGSFIAIIITSLFLLTSTTYAKENTFDNNVSQEQYIAINKIKKTINEEIKHQPYQWNEFKKNKNDNVILKSLNDLSTKFTKSLKRFFKRISDFFSDLMEQIFGSKKRTIKKTIDPDISTFRTIMNFSLWTILGIVVIIIIIVIVKIFRYYATREDIHKMNNNISLLEKVDLEEESISADKLKVNEWLELALKLEALKKYRLALRAYYLSVILILANKELVIIRKSKTDYEYLRDLKNKKHVAQELIEPFTNCITYFQKYWYGDYECGKEQLEEFKQLSEFVEDPMEEDNV